MVLFINTDMVVYLRLSSDLNLSNVTVYMCSQNYLRISNEIANNLNLCKTYTYVRRLLVHMYLYYNQYAFIGFWILCLTLG